MRKTLGAYKSQLVKQFLGESIVMSILALLVGLLIAYLLLPYFNKVAGKGISINFSENPVLFIGLIGIIIFVGLFAGSYPAFFLARFRPVQVFKGDIRQGYKSYRFRSILVVTQFVISIALIICTGIISDQINYMKNKRLGFNKEHMLVLSIQNNAVRDKIESIKAEMESLNGVESAAASEIVPGEIPNTSGHFPEGLPENQIVMMETFGIDADFIEAYGIDIIEGRSFSREFSTDPADAVLINEAAAAKFGWGEPIGKLLERPTGGNEDDFLERDGKRVIGVFKDFHIRSLYQRIEPTCLYYQPEYYQKLTLRLKTEDIFKTMEQIKEKWTAIDPGHPYEYFFLDESFDSQYRSEEKLGSIFRIFTFLAIFIGCLGLFGLASFTAEQRTKEIGIRKVLGASVPHIFLKLSSNFMKLVILANVFAWPVSYFIMNRWLENFAYRVDINIVIFILSALIALIIALVTVSYQSIKAAVADPVYALKHE